MKKQIVVFLSLIFSVASVVFAQTKTVTNKDLEKFRQKRLQAERDYRQNYERLGFPSPEELEKNRIEDQKNLIEFSQQLQFQRLEREAAQAEAEKQALWAQNQYLQSLVNDSNYQSSGFYTGYSPDNYGYFNSYRSGYFGRYNYGGRFFNNYPSGFFNLQFPPPRPPQRIRAPRSLNDFPMNVGKPRINRSNPRGNITIRTNRGKN
jgi:hypothetical protein